MHACAHTHPKNAHAHSWKTTCEKSWERLSASSPGCCPFTHRSPPSHLCDFLSHTHHCRCHTICLLAMSPCTVGVQSLLLPLFISFADADPNMNPSQTGRQVPSLVASLECTGEAGKDNCIATFNGKWALTEAGGVSAGRHHTCAIRCVAGGPCVCLYVWVCGLRLLLMVR